MLTGSELYEAGSSAEFLPYVDAGMVVIHYSIDGHMVENKAASQMARNDDEKYTQMLSRAYPQFRRSGAGVVNGRNAIDFAIQKIPAVDPNRIYSAGHSSAGTLSLLLATKDPRIKGCIAYAPAYDLERRMAEILEDKVAASILPGLKEFIATTSPKNFAIGLECPTFIFHAKADQNVPYSDAVAFAAQLDGQGTPLTFRVAEGGDHYTPMIDEGIPAAITWINNGAK